MEAKYIIPFLIEVSRYPLGLLAIGLCICIYIRTRQLGWLFLSAVFVDQFFFLAIHMIRGMPFPLHYLTVSDTASGIRVENISYQVPFFLIFAVIGLFLIAREKRKSSA